MADRRRHHLRVVPPGGLPPEPAREASFRAGRVIGKTLKAIAILSEVFR